MYMHIALADNGSTRVCTSAAALQRIRLRPTVLSEGLESQNRGLSWHRDALQTV